MAKKFFIPLLLSLLIFSACSNSSGAKSGDKAGGGSSGTKVAKVADAPEGCPSSTKLTAKTSDLKEISFTPKNSWLNVWGSTPDQANLTFATYEIPSGNPYITYTYSENDALVVVKLKDSVSNKVGLGSYVSNKDAKLRVVEANVSSKNLAGGVFDKNGTLEFAVFGPKYACGTMKFDDGYSLLKGEFIAEIVNK